MDPPNRYFRFGGEPGRDDREEQHRQHHGYHKEIKPDPQPWICGGGFSRAIEHLRLARTPVSGSQVLIIQKGFPVPDRNVTFPKIGDRASPKMSMDHCLTFSPEFLVSNIQFLGFETRRPGQGGIDRHGTNNSIFSGMTE